MNWTLDEFHFDLPQNLIAKYPAEKRDHSRLMLVNKSTKEIKILPKFKDIISILTSNDILVFNSTRVSKRRVYLKTVTGRVHECLFLEEIEPGVWKCLVKNASKLKQKRGLFTYDEKWEFFFERDSEFFSLLKTEQTVTEAFFEKYGSIPIPPYLKRSAEKIDEERYQTIFANESGSVAAPTAALHFTKELLDELKQKGIIFLDVCLKVGYGTFAPLTEKEINTKKLHQENYTIPDKTAKILNESKGKKRIIAIGTTTLRALESCLDENKIYRAGHFQTDLFIQPQDRIHSIDALITNFHLPQSSLLLLVSAFASKDLILKAYQKAIEEQMRFFSYGDAMFIF